VVRSLIAALGLALALAFPPVAAADAVDDAVSALREDPVYVAPDAERAITPAEADRIRDRIASADAGPMYVAILPASASSAAGGDADGVIRRLHDELGRDGTYAVVVGNSFRGGSTDFRGAGELATQALREHRGEGVAATLLAFVDAVAAERSPETSRGNGDGGGGFPWMLLLLVGIPAVLFLVVRGRRRRDRAAELAEVKQEVEADLVALAEDVSALDAEVERPGADPRAKEAYTRALDRYSDGSQAFERARSPEALEPVAHALEEGRYEMATTKALLEGREPPARRAPCFFDPRHGPSVAEVEWAPPGGAPRPVPVCADDLRAVERGEDPSFREVVSGGRRVPYWQAGPAFGPYAGGFFGGGLFPGILLGTMLAGPGFGGDGFGGDSFGGVDGGTFDDLGGGDFGDLGGGDFGGGDFGGGGDF
jgi:hypothetical protein